MKKNYFINSGALFFGMGIGGVTTHHSIFGTVCFSLAGIIWIAGEILCKEPDENEEG